MQFRRLANVLLVAAILTSAVAHAVATEPALRNLNVRGLQIAGTTSITIDGDDLGTEPKLLLPFAAQQTLKKGANPRRAEFDITLNAAVAPGYYQLRVVTDGGVSLPVMIAVDRMPQKVLAAETSQVPAALHGSASGSSVVETKFTGGAGQPVIIEVEAARLGSKLRPIVHLYGPDRRQIAWSWPTAALFGDTRLQAVLPAAGSYTVAVHDMEYAAPGGSFFRLRIGQWSYIDRVFPSTVAAGSQAQVDLIGASAGASAPTTQSTKVSAPTDVATMTLSPIDAQSFSGPRPFVAVSSTPELIEPGPWPNPHELPAPPIAVTGRFATRGEEDRFRLAVTPGMKLRCDVFAERSGSLLDAALVLRDDKGTQLARGEDGTNTLDPFVEYVVPAGTTSIIVGVVDAQQRGGSAIDGYRLVVESLTEPKPDFRLMTTAERLSLPIGGRGVVPVTVERRGYSGTIDLSLAAPPAGVKLSNTQIPADADGALVVAERVDGFTGAVVTSWSGGDGKTVRRPVSIKAHQAERVQPWLADEFSLAPTSAKQSDFQIDWAPAADDVKLVPMKNVKLPVKIARSAENEKVAVRLSLVTSQPPQLLANNQPDQTKNLRIERAVEIGAKTADGEIVMVVPQDLTSTVYDVTVMAELLSADKKTVTATAYAPVKRLVVAQPITLKPMGPTTIVAALDAKTGAVVRLAGKVERREGATGDVAVTLVGLPAGISAPVATVKSGTNDYAVNITVPANTPAGKLTGLKLQATTALDPKQPAVRVRSRDIDLTIVVDPAKTK